MVSNDFTGVMTPDVDKSMPGMDYTQALEQNSLKQGDIIQGRYSVVSQLGQGGMGIVYKCFDKVSQTECAVKTLLPELSKDSLYWDNLRANFQLVHNLHHDNIASYNSLEYDKERGVYYLVMEYVDGEPIDQYIKKLREKGSFSEKIVIDMVKKIAAALDFAHERKVLHRDIKPANIMIDKNGNVKIVDFGLAAVNHNTTTYREYSDSAVKGTPKYMAPEQWHGSDRCRAASDQYSLAVTVYEIFAGSTPFSNPDIELMRNCVLHEKPSPLKGVSPEIAYAVGKALSKNPKKRYKTCSDFAAALERNVWLEIFKTVLHESWLLLRKSEKPIKELYGKVFKLRFVRLILIMLMLSVLAMLGGKLLLGLEFYLWDLVVLPLVMLLVYGVIKIFIIVMEDGKIFWGCGILLLLGLFSFFYCRSLTFKAQHGNVLAMTMLAELEDNEAERIYWYRRAAGKGDSYAQYRYAEYLLARQDEQKAFQWFGAAANQNLARAQYELGNCYYYGRGTAQDTEKAVIWWKKAAGQGVNDAFEAVVYHYIVKNDLEKLSEWVKRKEAEYQGNAFYRGGIYWKKKDDCESAARWFAKGEKVNHPRSVYELAMLYRFGHGVEHNHNEALRLFEKACDLRVAEAPFFSGDYYENGPRYGMQSNYSRACKRYSDGNELKDPQARLRWADIVYYGKYGVEQNRNHAFELYSNLYKDTAQNSMADVSFKLGLCYWNGHGCVQNIMEAGNYFKEAVKKCKDKGEYWYYLGLYYKEVKAAKVDIDNAFRKASELGYKEAEDYL